MQTDIFNLNPVFVLIPFPSPQNADFAAESGRGDDPLVGCGATPRNLLQSIRTASGISHRFQTADAGL